MSELLGPLGGFEYLIRSMEAKTATPAASPQGLMQGVGKVLKW
jgi:hypothetical protein